ncbi:hypothetical protein BGZ58_006240 [Dissophora ornata]|nr:hypothetical protein BGZ58_006240 [Dissophora ornata]
MAMNSVKDYSLKRSYHLTQSQPSSSPCSKELERLTLAHSPTASSESLADTMSAPLSKRQRLESLTDFPNEILVAVQSYLTHPLDLLHFSQTCMLFRILTDEKAWHRLYMILVPVWSIGAQVTHLREDAMLWRQIVIDDFLRRNVHWVVDPDLSAAGDVVRGLDNALQPQPLGINLSQATHVKPPHMRLSTSLPAGSSRWRNVGPPASHTDSDNATVSAYMQARSYGNHKDHQIVIYGLPNHETPLAVISSDFWAHPSDDRVVDPDAGSLGVLEIHICDKPQSSELASKGSTGPRLVPYRPDPVRGRVETIAPSSPQELIRGRAVKLYSTTDPLTNKAQDNIALFGIHQGERQQAIVITCPLFVSSSETNTHSSHVLGDGTMESSCMALFPPQSDFEDCVVIMDKRGRGEIWNWLHRDRIAVLQMPESDTPLGLHDQDSYEKSHRNHLYYWGVQINWAIEEPGYKDLQSPMPFTCAGSRKHGDYRILALADGNDKEWETCWWQVNEQTLREHQDPRSCQNGVRASTWIIPPSNRHFEQTTMGKLFPSPSLPTAATNGSRGELGTGTDAEQNLLFVAYLIWDHYRVALTSQYGLCMFDMDQEPAGDIMNENQEPRQPQWVTLIENSADDPLIDIATVGDCLFLTRKYSHMMWPFRKPAERQS